MSILEYPFDDWGPPFRGNHAQVCLKGSVVEGMPSLLVVQKEDEWQREVWLVYVEAAGTRITITFFGIPAKITLLSPRTDLTSTTGSGIGCDSGCRTSILW